MFVPTGQVCTGYGRAEQIIMGTLLHGTLQLVPSITMSWWLTYQLQTSLSWVLVVLAFGRTVAYSGQQA